MVGYITNFTILQWNLVAYSYRELTQFQIIWAIVLPKSLPRDVRWLSKPHQQVYFQIPSAYVFLLSFMCVGKLPCLTKIPTSAGSWPHQQENRLKQCHRPSCDKLYFKYWGKKERKDQSKINSARVYTGIYSLAVYLSTYLCICLSMNLSICICTIYDM